MSKKMKNREMLIKGIEEFIDYTNRTYTVDIVNDNLLILSVTEGTLYHHTIAVCTNDTFICTDVKYRATFEILSDDFLDFVYKAGYNYVCTDYDEGYSALKIQTIALYKELKKG